MAVDSQSDSLIGLSCHAQLGQDMSHLVAAEDAVIWLCVAALESSGHDVQ